MGLLDIFKKKTYYFDKNMPAQCAYCAYGKRTKEGGRILCEKQGLMEETSSCNKFVYEPLKRIPTKQLNIEGALTEEEMYLELPEEVIQEMDLPEMPDEMKAPEITDALKAPDMPSAMEQTENLTILNETTVLPELQNIPEIPETVPDASNMLGEIPEIPETVPDISEILEKIPEVPDFSEEDS